MRFFLAACYSIITVVAVVASSYWFNWPLNYIYIIILSIYFGYHAPFNKPNKPMNESESTEERIPTHEQLRHSNRLRTFSIVVNLICFALVSLSLYFSITLQKQRKQCYVNYWHIGYTQGARCYSHAAPFCGDTSHYNACDRFDSIYYSDSLAISKQIGQ